MTVYTWSSMTQAQATAFTTSDGVVIDVGTAGATAVAIGPAVTRITVGGKSLDFVNSTLDADTLFTAGTPDEPVQFLFSDGSILGVHANGAAQTAGFGLLGAGNDYYVAQNDTSTALVDTVQGGAGNDTLIGGSGADQLQGQDGNDSLGGNTGNDGVLIGGNGNDSIFGGQGDDVLGAAGAAEDGNDSIAGDIGNDVIDGGDGNDSLFGLNDHDNILGGAGADSLSGNMGNDTLDGNAGADSVFGGKGDDVITNVGNGADSINGNIGTDTVTGGTGNDSIFGGQDGDVLAGGGGNDSVSGDLGNDTVGGTTGADTLVGGAGNDTFVFANADSGVSTTAGAVDQINDFVSGLDKIDLTDAGSVAAVAGAGGNYVELASQTTFANALTAANAEFAANATSLYVAVQVGSDTYLFGANAGADNAAEDAVKLVGVSIDGIQAADII